jgi:hypothetical protein
LKKVMLLAAMLAMVLAAAAPALSQTAAGGDVAVLQYSCNQIQAAVATQYQAGEGTGAVAGAAQSLGINQQQVLACFGTAVALQDSAIIVEDGTVKAAKKGTAKAVKKATPTAKAVKKATPAAKATATPTAKATATPTATATATAPAALPPTGGASAVALGAAALLVAGGLLARRIVR